MKKILAIVAVFCILFASVAAADPACKPKGDVT